jgi:putative peptidoglycan lipid II flippase
VGAEPPRPDDRAPRRSTGVAASAVAVGILGSRLLGLARQTLMANYLGAGVASDAFTAAFKIPNTLQNLFGEGALSAAFIPVYSRLLGRGERETADRVAGAVAAILSLAVAAFVLVGVLGAKVLIYAIAWGFTRNPEKLALTIRITRILFPGAGLLVLSAWCLGVLNSHRRFLLSYSAPMLWNVAMIVALVRWGADPDKTRVVFLLAWASVVGSALQFGVQLPTVRQLAPHARLAFSAASEHVREVMRNFGPVFVSRGVVQLSSYVDQWLTSFMADGIPTLFLYASTLYTLPVSLFGMAISAAELPEMARTTADAEQGHARLRERLDGGLRRIAFFVIPSAVAFLALGDVVTRLVYEHGAFTAIDAVFTWGILAGSSVGLLAGTLGRLYSSTYYALSDTRTPLRFALIRVLLTTVLGAACAFPLPRALGIDPRWGAAGLTASAGVAGWVEFVLLRSRLNRRIGVTGISARFTATLWALAVASAAIAILVQQAVFTWPRYPAGIAVLGAYGAAYIGGALLVGVPEARAALRGKREGGRGRRE